MRISVSHRPLLEIEVRANPELIRSYLFSRDGLWRHLTLVIMTALLTIAAPAFQAALPQAVPELPFHPLAWTTAYLATRRSRLTACLAAIVIGVCYDAITFQALGGTSTLLLVIALAARFLARIVPKTSFTRHCLLQGAAASLVYAAGKIIFFSYNMPMRARLNLVPSQLCGGMLLAFVSVPLLFAALDGLECVFSGRRQPPAA
ncbi:MAG TPA: hypothetical protein PLE92_07460 [Lentisphaeria bacterium]|nr:hypothetical protein [Lentisphaerota bacterium]OQC12060.1 MAG: hypothetical protein BWX73_03221 [Lentisphaerae bacterium ADurb.Bin082]HPY91523.1 hypothetical protein [Lentisphaeria bacterium]HQC52954.1 hypothetical protein [Lentisphaeria bacterium]HQL87082.1 hypothetical protein [Lentisphaeria bacterium]